MRFIQLILRGLSPLLCNSAAAMDPGNPLHAEKRELGRKREASRTPEDAGRLAFIDTYLSMWRTADDLPTFPPGGVRAALEAAARKTKDGPSVREGLIVFGCSLRWDRNLGATCREIAASESARLTVPVAQQRARILRTRAIFREWSLIADVGHEPTVVEEDAIIRFAEIAGARIGLGDWRPGKSGGPYGRFAVESVQESVADFSRTVGELRTFGEPEKE